MQLVLRAAGIIGIIVSVIWWVVEPSFDPLYAFITGLVALLSSYIIPNQETKGETLDQRNRRVMLDHVENFWVKGILEKSLHGAALIGLGIKEDPSAVNYPWTIKKESTNETLPSGKSMLEIFKEVGLGRSMLILGAPGSGKTTMLLELTRLLIEQARQVETEPIPVVFNLSSWKENQMLADWLAEQLNIVYYVPKKIAPVWVNEARMSLLLDGLDEVRADNRLQCIETINQFRKKYGLTSLVVCSRIEEYSALNTKLSIEGAITLQPLTSQQANAYFDRFGKSLARVKQLLKKDDVLRELAETPLMLSIMALAYKDRTIDELVTSGNLEEQRNHLFDTYINLMFERSNRTTNAPFSKKKTLQYLSWLAGKMIQHNIIAYQMEEMQPSWLPNQHQGSLYRLYLTLIGALIIGLNFGLIGGLIGGLSVGLIDGLSVGLIGGLIFGLIVAPIRSDRIFMVDRLKWSWEKAWNDLSGGLHYTRIVALSVGLIGGLIAGLIATPIVGLIFGLTVWLFLALTVGMTSEQIEETTYPGQHLKQTLSNSLFSTLIFGLIFGLSLGLVAGLVGGLTAGLLFGLIFGLSFGVLFGLTFGYGPLIQHYVLRSILARHHFIPRQLIAFLEHSVDLIFLRRVGGGYIFVHRFLMEYFAEMEV